MIFFAALVSFLFFGWAESNPAWAMIPRETPVSILAARMDGPNVIVQRTRERVNGGDWATYYVLSDPQGNVMALATSDGTLVAQYDYDPYGRLIRETGPNAATCPFRYSTKYRDPDLDLHYYGYRWYDAASLKWLTPDPIGERGGANLTAFCNGDPINHVDPLGLFTLEGMYEHFLTKYGDRGLRLLRFLSAEGWTIEGRDFWWPRVSFDEGVKVVALELDWSDQKAADKLFKALSARYDKVLGRFLRGAGAIVGASIVAAESLGLEGYEGAWTESEAELGRIGSLAQRAIENEAKWMLFSLAAYKTAELALDAIRARRLITNVRRVSTRPLPGKLYHYTSADPYKIIHEGLIPGASGKVYTTPVGDLSPLQAQIDLALPPNGGLPVHLIDIDVETLLRLGIKIPEPQLVGRMFNMPGGGIEIVFPHALPPEALRVIR